MGLSVARAPAAKGSRWLQWRNHLLGSARFRRWAAGFWLTRGTARRQAAELFDLLAGFVYAQVVLACVRSGLIDALAQGPADADTLARHCHLPVDGLERLLAAAASLRLVQRDGERWVCGPLGVVLATDPAIRAMVVHHEVFYNDLRDPIALLNGQSRPTGLQQFWAYARSDSSEPLADAQVADYSRLMTASQPLVAEQVLDAVDLGRHQTLLDVGGGEGGFLAAVAQRHPQLTLMLFDLPAVVRRAETRLTGLGLGVQAVGGDFKHDALPAGADVVSLVRVLHDHDDAVVLGLLQRVRQCLKPGGRVLIAEPMAGTAGAPAMGDAYFGLYLWAMGSGRPRSADQLRQMLLASGFRNVRTLPTRQPLQAGVLSAWV